MSTEVSLAPAAGTGIGKLLADALLARPGFVQLMADTAENGLRAMSPRRWDKESEEWIQDEDHRTRVTTLTLLLAHMEGEPVKRIIHQHLGGQGTVDPLAALQDSEPLREAARRLLDKAEFRTRHTKRAEKTEPEAIEVS